MNVNEWICPICGKKIYEYFGNAQFPSGILRLNPNYHIEVINHVTMHLQMVIQGMKK